MEHIEKTKNQTDDNRVAQLEDEIHTLKAQLDKAYGSVEKEWLRAIDNIPDGVMFRTLRDAQTRTIKFDYVSSRWEKMLGVTKEDSLADMRNVFKHLDPADLQNLMQSIENSYDPLTNFSVDVRYVHPITKEDLWLRVSSYPRSEEDFIYADGFIFDITTHKVAELELESKNKYLEELGSKMPDGTIYHSIRDSRTKIFGFDYVSETWEKVLGVTAEEALADARNVFKNVHPEDLPMLMQRMDELLEPLGKLEIEVRYNHPVMKKEIWVQIASYPRLEGDNILATGFIFNITNRKLAEVELQAEKTRLETLGDNLPNLVLFQFVYNTQTEQMYYSYVSGTWEKMTGIPAGVAMKNAQIFFDTIHPDDWQDMKQALEHSLATLNNFHAEVRTIVDGRTYWRQMSSRPRREGILVITDGAMLDVTVRKETERKLELEHERLETLGNNLPDVALYQFTGDPYTHQWALSYVSGTWESVTGISADAAMNDINSFFSVVHPNDLQAMVEGIETSGKTLENLYLEIRLINRGRTRWLQISSRPRREGSTIIADGVIMDITHRKEASRELELEKNRLQLLANNIPGGRLFQFILNTQTNQMRMSYLSSTKWQEEGVSLADAMTDISKLLSMVHPDDLSNLMQNIDHSTKTMTDLEAEFRFGSNNQWMHIVSRPRHDDLLIIWDGIIMNITHRKELERELNAEKNRLQTLGDNIPGGSLFQFVRHTMTRQMRLSYVSATWESVTGIAADVAMANISNVFSTIQPEELTRLLEGIDHSAQTMTDFHIEILMGARCVQITSRPRYEGALIVWDSIIMDITERNMAEKELIRAKEKAEESDRLKSAFLANMSHEIRTPLNGIVGVVQLLNSGNLTDEERKEYIGIVNNSTSQLVMLIGDIVDISQIDAKQLSLNAAPVQINNLMDELKLSFETCMRAKKKEHIKLILERSGFIDNDTVCVDPIRLKQVLTNLMNNAVKFTEKGHIRFGYKQSSSSQLEFMVEDTGIGLKPEHKEIIFERFRQVNPANTRTYEGAGLGLSISHGLVQIMGGNLWVESVEGKGSTFYFTIDYVPVTDENR